MNRRNSILKLAGILLVAGLALYFVGMGAFAAQDRTTSSHAASSITYEKKEFSAPADGIESIVIQARNMPITVRTSTGNEIVLSYYTSEKDPYDVVAEGGEFSLKYRNRNLINIGEWFNNWDIFNVSGQSNPEVVIDVPQAYAGSFRLDTSNAAITVSGFTEAAKVAADTSNGTVRISDMTAAQMDVGTSNGNVTLENVISSGSITARTSNGSVTVNQAAAKDRLYLETSNGHVAVDKVTSKEIELHSSNASISGAVGGTRDDYTISSSTSNADNNLGSGGNGPCRLKVDTSNGSINIRFLGE